MIKQQGQIKDNGSQVLAEKVAILAGSEQGATLGIHATLRTSVAYSGYVKRHRYTKRQNV